MYELKGQTGFLVFWVKISFQVLQTHQTSPNKETNMNWALLEYLSMIHILFTCKLSKKEKKQPNINNHIHGAAIFWVFWQHQTSPNTTINLNWTIFFFWDMGGSQSDIFWEGLSWFNSRLLIYNLTSYWGTLKKIWKRGTTQTNDLMVAGRHGLEGLDSSIRFPQGRWGHRLHTPFWVMTFTK